MRTTVVARAPAPSAADGLARGRADRPSDDNAVRNEVGNGRSNPRPRRHWRTIVARETQDTRDACQICNDCQGWESERAARRGNKIVVGKWPKDGFRIRTTVHSLTDSANNGCPPCGIFRDTIAHFVPAAEDDWEVEGWLPMSGPDALPCLEVKHKGLSQYERGFIFSFFTTPGKPSPWKLFGPGKLFPEDTSSPETLEQTKQWLHDCSATHPDCQIDSPPSGPLPTRVLDVTPPTVKLYVTQPGETGQYATLSHCWGTSQMLKTEHPTLTSRLAGIPWTSIPKTFQDAIAFVRGLNIKHLWIDSLCIIQDDPDDWARESAQMASIYRNSLVTIASARSSDSTGGCFSAVPPLGRTRPITGSDSISGAEFTVYARPDVQNWERPSLLPLYSRAWCFQERILSPRVVYFCHEQVRWECRSCTTSEAALGPTGYYPDNTSQEKSRENNNNNNNGLGKDSSDPRSMNDTWRRLVREYVELDLTYASDRLPALSGMAKHVQQTSGRTGRYLAGLWEDSLLEDLMWWVREEDLLAGAAVRPDVSKAKCQAPSWSWASIEGHGGLLKVQHRIYPVKKVHCKIEKVEVTPATAFDPTGAVKCGKLVMEGMLVPGNLRYQDAEEEEQPGTKQRVVFRVEIPSEAGGPDDNPVLYQMYADYQLDKRQPGGSNFLVSDGQDIWCFCLATDQWHKCWLVLRKPHASGDAYERIGMAWQSHKQIDEGKDWPRYAGGTTTVAIL
ncbi:heterokaryon incompatibility protein-domain-containing protein [Diplogelasinospora grovesii]|uniref:Heterokaryon incompatibility protein-domain-containing protein n=1 Tax=Diplogelasinospora grovesii TaxID=303347 RepID=A0AAN6MV62_9PEZI|nr:heterokaryon incompatibility protein-domain-containing protein [Diplogelasinospora grovesii]